MNLPATLFILLWNFAPLRGLATWYGPPLFNGGDIMRNGQVLDLSARTVAVDASYVDWLDRKAIVLTECGGVHIVTVTDTGQLYKAGRFRLGISRFTNQLRYWPVVPNAANSVPVLQDTIDWQGEGAITHRIVADFPRDFFLDEISCDGNETLEVRIYVWQSP